MPDRFLATAELADDSGICSVSGDPAPEVGEAVREQLLDGVAFRTRSRRRAAVGRLLLVGSLAAVDVEAEVARQIAEFLAAVSFESGGRPRYERIRELFIRAGMLIRNSGPEPEVTSVDEFIAPRQRSVDSGELTAFRESELDAVTELFGGVAHRFSAYEKRGTLNGDEFAGRGFISTQFVRTPDGWKMSSMAWDDEPR